MAIKIYNKGGAIVIEDGTELTQSVFQYQSIGDNINILDINSEDNVWNVDYSEIQNESGSAVGSSVATVLDYLGALTSSVSSLGFSTSTLLTNGQTYDSTVLDMSTYTQVQTSILSDKNGTIVIDFIRDSAGTDILRTLTIPYVGGSGFKMFSSVAFTPYVRYRFTCDETGQTDFYFDTKFTKTGLSPQILDLNAFVSDAMVSTLGRSLLLGQDGDGSFSNVSVVETSNDAGTYHSLQVVNGARPSQLFGRTAVSIVVDGVSASSLLHTVTADKTFYVTDINLTVDNSASVAGVLKLENGIIASQPVVTCYMIGDPPGSASSNTVISHSYIEPLQFDTGVWLNESAGTLIICGTINGYEE